MSKEQIGIMGSMADKELHPQGVVIAEKIGELLAKENVILVYGYEGDFNSLSEIAARAAEKHGGQTLAFLWGKEPEISESLASIVVRTGMIRGGGREFPLVLSCDGIICISGGSGTLTEIAMAYQAGVPVVTMAGTGGISEQVANTYLDSRQRILILSAETPEEAVALLLQEVKKKKQT